MRSNNPKAKPITGEKMIEYKNWEWSPSNGVGPLKYGALIQDYLSEYPIRLLEPEGSDVTGWGTYEIENSDKTIWTEEGKIVSIRCDEYFVYKGNNLIGLSKIECIAYLQRQPDEVGEGVLFEDGTVQKPLEFDELGLEVWLEDGKIVSASAYDPEDE